MTLNALIFKIIVILILQTLFYFSGVTWVWDDLESEMLYKKFISCAFLVTYKVNHSMLQISRFILKFLFTSLIKEYFL